MNETKMAFARVAANAKYASGYRPNHLLSDVNTKLLKGLKRGVMTLGLSLAPARASGYNLCPNASPECEAFCLFGSGRAGEAMHAPTDGCNPTWVGRIVKALWYKRDPFAFKNRLVAEIDKGRVRAQRKGLDLAVRLNVFSDIVWENEFPELFELFPEVHFYDYTAIPFRMTRPRPSNYHLTFSLKENNLAQALAVVAAGANIAAIVRPEDQSSAFFGYPTVNGDEHDLRYLDPLGHVVLLKPKGPLAQSHSAFIYGPQAA